jgi:hypothetical protein
MKGYFSKLARHTGLRIGSGSRTTAAASPAPPTQPKSELRELSVEEVTFTDLSQPVNVGTFDAGAPAAAQITAAQVTVTSDRNDARRPERADNGRDVRSESDASRIHKPSAPAIEVTAVNLTDSDLSTSRNLPSTEIETHVFDHPRVVISLPTSMDEQTPASGQIPESVSGLELRNATSARQFDFGDPRREMTSDEDEPGRYSRSTQQSEAGLDERVERQLVVRNYLKEISEWISTPVAAEEEPASFSSDDSGASAGDPARRAERMDISERDRWRASAPEQQDLTLSIGTIKIVVEEPRAQAAAPPAPPATTERTFERTTTAPADLSRYYINRW